MGRTFTEEDQQGGCSVVLEHSFWATTLAADPSIVGKSLTLDQKSCTVLGVMPPRVAFFQLGRTCGFWSSMIHRHPMGLYSS